MKNPRKHARETRIWLIVVGITILVSVFFHIKAGHHDVVVPLLLTVWMILYVDYVQIKTRLDILDELDASKKPS